MTGEEPPPALARGLSKLLLLARDLKGLEWPEVEPELNLSNPMLPLLVVYIDEIPPRSAL